MPYDGVSSNIEQWLQRLSEQRLEHAAVLDLLSEHQAIAGGIGSLVTVLQPEKRLIQGVGGAGSISYQDDSFGGRCYPICLP